MSVKVVVRLTDAGNIRGGSTGSAKVSPDLATLELLQDQGTEDPKEHLRFDRVYPADIPTSDVFSDGIWSLVKLAMIGRSNNVIVVPLETACPTTAHQHPKGTAHRKAAPLRGDSSIARSSELGLGLTLVLLLLDAMFSMQAASGSKAGISMSWCRFSSVGAESSDVLLELCHAGRLHAGQIVTDASHLADVEEGAAPLPTQEKPCARLALSSADGLFETLQEGSLDVAANNEHSMCSVVVSAADDFARDNGSLHVYSLASTTRLAPSAAPLDVLINSMQGAGWLADAPNNVPALPLVERCMTRCFQPQQKTLIILSGPHRWHGQEVPAQLRLGAKLREIAAATRQIPPGVANMVAAPKSSTRVSKEISPRRSERQAKQNVPSSTHLTDSQRMKQQVVGAAQSLGRGYSRSSSRGYDHRGASVAYARQGNANHQDKASRSHDTRGTDLNCRSDASLAEPIVLNQPVSKYANTCIPAQIAPSAPSQGKSTTDEAIDWADMEQALRAKDRAIMEMQDRADEARQREARLVEALDAARSEVEAARCREMTLRLEAESAWSKDDAMKTEGRLQQQMEDLKLKMLELHQRFEAFHTQSSREQRDHATQGKAEIAGRKDGVYKSNLEVHGNSPCTHQSSSLGITSPGAARPWEMEELRGFLEVRFGSLELAFHHISSNLPTLGVEAFLKGLNTAGYDVEDEDVLSRLWRSLDRDNDGLITVADFQCHQDSTIY